MAEKLKEPASVAEAIALRGGEESEGRLLKLFKSPSSWKDETRTARFTMTSQAPDRYGDEVMTEGLDTVEFEKNPVGLLFHMSRGFPIGSWSNLEKKATSRPPKMEGDLTLLPAGADETADRAATHIKFGTLRACSIGFRPLELELIRDKEDNWTGGIRWLETELVECSLVPIPAHPKAMAKALDGDDAALTRIIQQQIDEFLSEMEQLGVKRDLYIEALAKLVPTKTISVGVTPGKEFDATVAVTGSVKPDLARVAEMPEPERRSLLARFAKVIGLAADEPAPRVEPKVEVPPPPPVKSADPDEVKALVAQAKAHHATLEKSGRI